MPPTPDPVHLTLGSRTLASAYPHRPPGKRSPHWSWRLAYKCPRTGKRTFKSLGRLAPADVPDRMLSVYEGIDPEAMVTDNTGLKTVADLLRAWFGSLEARSEAAALSPHTMSGYKRNAIYIRDLLGDVPLKALRQSHFEEFRDRMVDPSYRRSREASQAGHRPFGPPAKGKGYGVTTINHALVILTLVLSWGQQRGLGAIPSRLQPRKAQIKVKRGQESKVRRYADYTPTDAEIEAFHNQCRRKAGSVRLFTLLAWRTGGRAGEIGRLRWSDIIEARDGHYVRLEGKTGVRRVAISPDVAEEILGYRRTSDGDNDALFAPTYGRRAARYMKQALKTQGVPTERQWTPHGIRRRWCLSLLEAGVPVSVYADQAGHSPQVALEHYARISDHDRRAAAVRVEAHEDIHGWLGDHGMTVAEAIEILNEHLMRKRQN